MGCLKLALQSHIVGPVTEPAREPVPEPRTMLLTATAPVAALGRPHALRTQFSAAASSSSRALLLGSSGLAQRRQQRCRLAPAAGPLLSESAGVAALPAAASEAFMDAVEKGPDTAAQLAAAEQQLADAQTALLAAQAAAESDPTDLVFTVLFTIAGTV